MKTYEHIFLVSILFIHIAYLALAIGLFKNESSYLKELDFWLKVFMSVILLWKFNPYDTNISEFDRNIAFSAGIFLALMTFVDRYFSSYIGEAKESVRMF